MTVRAYLALGSNLGDKQRHLEQAVERLRALEGVVVLKVSRFIVTPALTPPEDPRPQPDYLNGAVELDTTLAPAELLRAVKRLERELGRADATRWAPRVIDIDVLFYGDQVIDAEGFQVPHPQLHKRRFVLEPLVELSPQLEHPVLHQTVRQMLDTLS
ncbi:MAG: 2-amino-4-hydroxy-6-hydroxymethyldihydropteridine diphosphokinase [Myxococcaceae bacterium]